ncbi:MAG: Nucleotidyl transferase [Parcubacteria group bacterium GW2011_GWF2_39_13b]|nr:MAG: Nucleotidyl transferase [Parcubacteria group bacterium GW2011_GWF2_39_13b]
MNKTLNILIPMAGGGKSFTEAGYTFPKPLIDIGGKTMIEVVINNLRSQGDHKFIFVCLREHYEKYDLLNILKRATNNKFEVVQIGGNTEGALCTALCAIEYINNDNNLIIANADQYFDLDINDFIASAKEGEKDGLIMTFNSSHPKWSYARADNSGKVLETAEKKVISDKATVGVYYFRRGAEFVKAAQEMLMKNIRYNNEFYICPVFNEMILEGKNIFTYHIEASKMRGLGTPEDLKIFMQAVADGKIKV